MKKQNFSFLNYDTSEIPLFKEKQGQKWVNYGVDNLYGDYLRDLFLASSTHGAIVNGVADMIYGGGLDATDREENDEKKEQWIRLQDLLNNSDHELLQKISFDIKLYGMTYLNVIWNASRTRIAELKHLPVHTIRCGVADSEGVISEFYYKYDWHDRRSHEKVIQAFEMDNRTEASTCLQIKRYSVAQHYYSVPDYVGSTNYIELDREVSQFHLSNIKRGFFPSMLLSFKNGVPTQEERIQIERKVMDKFTGADQAGRILITFNDGEETAPTFTPIDTNNADGMYEYLSKTVSEKILTGHRVVSPLIFGVRTEGGGFGSNAEELRDSYSLFNNTVIEPFQNILLKALGNLFAINDIELDIYFITAKPADFLDLDTIDALDEGEQEKEGVDVEELKQVQLKVANVLIELGEDESEILKGYEKIDERKVEENTEPIMDALFNFASVIPSTGNDGKGKSKQDNELIKVRYRYAPDRNTHKPQRDFCSDMITAGKVYTRENILAGFGANPGFGIDGAPTYDIWFYKGGPNCYHWWERVTYLQKNNQKITVNEARRLITSLPPNERDAVRIPTNPKEVAKRPIDMPNRGYYN
jgi:capsid portal protein